MLTRIVLARSKLENHGLFHEATALSDGQIQSILLACLVNVFGSQWSTCIGFLCKLCISFSNYNCGTRTLCIILLTIVKY
jgi:hypothetical protein